MGQRVELLPHLVGADNGLGFSVSCISRVPLLHRVLNQALQVLLLQRVHHIEEVISARVSALGQLVREVLHEYWVLHCVWPQIDDGKLVKLRHVHHFYGTHGQELLLSRDDLAQEIFVAHQGRWSVQLDYRQSELNQSLLTLLREVVEEIILALEAVHEFCRQVALFAWTTAVNKLAFLLYHKDTT